MVFRIPCAFLLCLMQGETPWNPEILSHEPKLNDSSGAFYACCALPGVGDVGGVWHSGMESLLKRGWFMLLGPSRPNPGASAQVMDFQSSTGSCYRPKLIKIVYSMTMHDSS